MTTFTGEASKAPRVAEEVGSFQLRPKAHLQVRRRQQTQQTVPAGLRGRDRFRQRTGVGRLVSEKAGSNLCRARHAVLPWSCRAPHSSDTFDEFFLQTPWPRGAKRQGRCVCHGEQSFGNRKSPCSRSLQGLQRGRDGPPSSRDSSVCKPVLNHIAHIQTNRAETELHAWMACLGENRRTSPNSKLGHTACKL